MTRTVLLIPLLAACATTPSTVEKRPEVAGTPAKDYYPLAVGTAWTYKVVALGAPPQEQSVQILKDEGGTFHDSTGNQLFTDAFGVRDQKRYLLRDPVEVGTEWSNVVSVSSVERYRIVAANVACDSPAGHFENCAVVESTNKVEEGKALVNELTFAPKIGLVRISTLLVAAEKRVPQVTLELTKYTVVPGK
jgi:hypothetical protein